jgi:hypothetical protein
LEIIYKSNQRTKQGRLGFEIDSVLITREAQALLFEHKTECLKSEAQVLVFTDESKKCIIEVHINN